MCGSDIAEIGYTQPDDVVKAIDSAESMVFNLSQGRAADSMAPIRELLDANLDRLEQLYEQGDSITGTPTGFLDLDELFSGSNQATSSSSVPARPWARPALRSGWSRTAAMHAERPVLFFSLEMSQLEISQRLLCSEARVDATRVRNGKLTEDDWSRISHGVGRLAEAPVWIDDNPNTTVMEIRAKARRLKSKVGDLSLVVVDYMQLMTGRNGAESRQVEVSEISRGLKILARELECPVVALSQLSRQLEQRQDKRPMLSDLRESGSIEQDADVVMFLYRDDVYDTDSPDLGTAEVLIAKHRSGPTGMVRLAFLPHFTRFANMAKGA